MYQYVESQSQGGQSPMPHRRTFSGGSSASKRGKSARGTRSTQQPPRQAQSTMLETEMKQLEKIK